MLPGEHMYVVSKQVTLLLLLKMTFPFTALSLVALIVNYNGIISYCCSNRNRSVFALLSS